MNKECDPEKSVEWEANRYCWEIRWGSGAVLENLKLLYETNPRNKKAGLCLGQAYETLGAFDAAGEHFKQLSGATNIINDKVEFLCQSLLQYSYAKNQEMVSQVLREVKCLASTDVKNEIELLNTLIALYKENEVSEFYLAILERYLTICPDDYDKRFSLALLWTP